MPRNNLAGEQRQKLIVIVGPTASGKSALAVSLAKKFDGEIISADSRQVYRNLDIGTGKVTKKEMAGIRHHLLDVASPRQAFTAAQFKSHAERAIRDITQRGKMSIIAGGTAFWIDTLVYDLSLPEVKPNARLRHALEKKSAEQLLAILKKMDPRRAAGIEQQNPRRLIRAIEIARALGAVPKLKQGSPYHTLWIGINPAGDAWTRRVHRRVEAMIKQGLVAETKKLLRQGVPQKRIGEFGFEYAAARDAAQGRISRADLAKRVIRDTKKYAQRQMRWWKRNTGIHWIRSAQQRQVPALVKRFLQENS